jgi:guanosine-3',5'-bis(diphosphate) 3'-pyrophosphohydrolase
MRLFKERLLQVVESFAVDAHKGQKRKYSNKAYITHPIEVAIRVQDRYENITMVAAALLHDVLEDTKVTHSELRAFLHRFFSGNNAEKILSLVVELTDVYTKESFPGSNRKERKHLEALRLAHASDEAKQIKLIDIEHNSESILEHDSKFAKVFLEEKKELLLLLDS